MGCRLRERRAGSHFLRRKRLRRRNLATGRPQIDSVMIQIKYRSSLQKVRTAETVRGAVLEETNCIGNCDRQGPLNTKFPR
jgi:hypothetical protein